MSREKSATKREKSTHHSFRPLIHYLHQPELKSSKLFTGHLVSLLHALNALCNREDGITSFLEFGRYGRFDVRFLLEDEARQEGNDFLGLVRGKSVLENELSKNEFVCGVDLGCIRMRDYHYERGENEDGRTSHATRPLSSTVELSSMNLSS